MSRRSIADCYFALACESHAFFDATLRESLSNPTAERREKPLSRTRRVIVNADPDEEMRVGISFDPAPASRDCPKIMPADAVDRDGGCVSVGVTEQIDVLAGERLQGPT